MLSAVCDSCGGMIEVEIERADGDTLAVGHALRGMGIGVDMTAVTAVPDKNPAQLIAERFVPEA